MLNQIHSRYVASISDLKKSPMDTLAHANGEPVAILNRNTPAFYCVPAELYEKMLDRLDNQELIKLAEERQSEKSIKVTIGDLRAKFK
ncbi:type II toxin-antitoxin system Phd/YefM family antitoxin [Moraxella oblonga]|uniref:type II toxin-antitoxin system Phd/YefM family antitoxin n=1 Tax=Moraxella oblonga TaxID=200413 RepID=UPI00082B5D58|nr:type II toxin-antitoxin system Phd/YefM family antitoxin [Moraxella oblonga]